MESSDSGTFERAFKRVSGAFAKGWKPGEFDTTVKAYFEALRHVSIDVVVEAGDRCIRTRTRFPKVADWLADVGSSMAPGTAPPGMRYMTEAERDEHAQAAAQCYQDAPCDCLLCQSADVSTRALRFVPTVIDGSLERAFNPRRNVVEVVGHWAHGQELARWYAAHEACRTAWPQKYRRALRLVDREPGEEG